MSEYPDLEQERDEKQRRKVRLTSLEADIAYFQARLEILGEPETVNQLAQRRTYKLLRKSLGDLALETRRKMLEGN